MDLESSNRDVLIFSVCVCVCLDSHSTWGKACALCVSVVRPPDVCMVRGVRVRMEGCACTVQSTCPVQCWLWFVGFLPSVYPSTHTQDTFVFSPRSDFKFYSRNRNSENNFIDLEGRGSFVSVYTSTSLASNTYKSHRNFDSSEWCNFPMKRFKNAAVLCGFFSSHERNGSQRALPRLFHWQRHFSRFWALPQLLVNYVRKRERWQKISHCWSGYYSCVSSGDNFLVVAWSNINILTTACAWPILGPDVDLQNLLR